MIKKILIIVCWFFLSASADAATYYVAQSSSGAGDGTAYADRASVAYHNAGSGVFAALDGDTVYLCGAITSQVSVPDGGASGSVVTYRGDYGGDAGTITYAGSGFYAYYKDYGEIKNITVVGQTTADNSTGGIKIHSSDNWVIDNCTIYNHSFRGVYAVGVDQANRVTNVTVKNSEIYNNTNTTAGGDIIGLRADHWVIQNNELYSNSASWGKDGAAFEDCQYILIENNQIYDHNYNTSQGEDGIDLKKRSDYAIIRYNHIYNHNNQSGITIQMDSRNTHIYGNRIHGNKSAGILVTMGSNNCATGDHNPVQDMTNINIWANLIYENTGPGVYVSSLNYGCNGYGIDGVKLYNNTIAENGSTNAYAGGIVLREGETGAGDSGHTVKNNLLYKNIDSSSNHYQVYVNTSNVKCSFDNNTFYYPGESGQDLADNDGTPRNLTEWNALSYVGTDAEADISLTDEDNNDYTPDGTYINNGEDLSGLVASYTINGVEYNVYFDDVLDPNNTDWTTTPPTVAVLDQDNYGAAWERGAYVFPIAVYNVSPANGATGVSVTAVATWSEDVDDADVYLDKAACSTVDCDGTLVSDDDADKSYDMSTLDTDSTYCLSLIANSGASQGDCQEFEFTTAPGDPVTLADMVQSSAAGDILQSTSAGDIITQ